VSAPGSPRHLVRRFFGSLRARRPSPADQSWIASLLTAAEAELFWAQPVIDQDHAVTVGRRAQSSATDPVLLAAALLHDVGKRHSRTGVCARSFASGLGLLHLPVRGRWRAYLDHGPLGAADLRNAGSADLIVAFAEHHHGERPDGVALEAWPVLSAADGE